MIRLIRFIFTGYWYNHECKYVVLSNGIITVEDVTIGSWYNLQCEKCGRIKRTNLTA